MALNKLLLNVVDVDPISLFYTTRCYMEKAVTSVYVALIGHRLREQLCYWRIHQWKNGLKQILTSWSLDPNDPLGSRFLSFPKLGRCTSQYRQPFLKYLHKCGDSKLLSELIMQSVLVFIDFIIVKKKYNKKLQKYSKKYKNTFSQLNQEKIKNLIFLLMLI